MAKQHKIFPPVTERRMIIRRRVSRILVNLLFLVGFGVLYYFIFSAFFDTPSENAARSENERLELEFENLNQRLAMLEDVLDNVSQRDENVFGILFESEPYDLNSTFEASRFSVMEQVMTKTNNELSDLLLVGMDQFADHLSRRDHSYRVVYDSMRSMGDRINFIPSIQPVINNELTLLTASFGMRIHPFYKSLSQHNGVDYTVAEGSRVFATADGTVKESIRRPSSSGLTVVISHDNGYETYYSHLSEVMVKKGQKVRRGDIIALSGNTGLSLVPHLHYEVRYNGVAVDPIHYFFMELGPADYQRMIRIARSGMQSFD